MPFTVLLVALVTVAAGIGSTSHLTRARWLPHHFRPKPTYGGKSMPGAAQQPSGAGFSLPTWLIVTAVVIVAVALVVLAVLTMLAVLRWRRKRYHGLASAGETADSPPHVLTGQGTTNQAEAELDLEPEQLLTGLGLALAVLDEKREPADAVVRAWLGLQETAQESGIVRRASETPTEFTARILRGAFADDRAVRTLLRLYLRARFGDHPVTAQDVVEVREALQELVSSWRPAGGARAARARR